METVECHYCGKKIEKYPSRIKERNFCSTDCHTNWNTGSNNPSWNGGQETVSCEQCGDSFEKWPSEPYRFCSIKCKIEDERLDVEVVPDKYFYNSQGWYDKRSEIRERDDNMCQWCGGTENLHVHHLRPMSLGGDELDEKNLVTLCQRCHSWAHKAIDYGRI